MKQKARHSKLTLNTSEAMHEISNALTAILGFADMLTQEDRLSIKARKAALHILANARLAHTLSRTQITSPESSVATDASSEPWVDASQELAVMLEQALVLTEVSRVQLEFSIAPGVALGLSSQDLWSIVWNLVKNAIEVSPPEAKVEVSLNIEDDDALIEVRDHGQGVRPSLVPKIFAGGLTTKKTGAGIGLALVHRLVTAAGGHIEVKSKLGVGTTFKLRFKRMFAGSAVQVRPDRKGRGLAKRRKSSSGVVPTLHGVRILLVDDEPSVCEVMATALELRGALVSAVGSSPEALALIKLNEVWDMAIVDLTLGKDRGDDLLLRLKEQRAVSKTILMSGAEPSKRLIARVKPDGWLRKPFELDDLVQAVATTVLTEPETSDLAPHSRPG